jgi:PEP-CTERM motif
VRIHRFAYGVAAIALLGFGATAARANSRAGVGTTGPGSPSCSTFAVPVNGSGAIVLTNGENDCNEDFNAISIEVIGTAPLTLYSPLLEVPTADDSGKGLSELAANLLLLSTGTSLEWTQTCGADGADFECTLTAPTPNAYDLGVLATLAKAGITNDGDCDRDDTILFVPKGCDLFFTTGAIGNLKGDSAADGDFLSPNEVVTSESFGVPEPGTVVLLLAGMVGLFAFRRKHAL